MDFLIVSIIEIIFRPLIASILNAWRWVLSASYRGQLSQELAQTSKFRGVFVYLWGALSFLLGLLMAAGLALLIWWLLVMSPGSLLIQHAVLKHL